MKEQESGLAGRMDDFAFEIVSEPEAKTETLGSDYEAILEAKADEILQELRGA
jgi:hypothetical protein